MGIGMVLGGAAKGLASAEQVYAESQDREIRNRGLMQDAKLREQAMGIQQQHLDQSKWRDLMTQAGQQITSTTSLITETIKSAREAGNDPQQIAAAVEPLVMTVEELSQSAGLPSTIRQRVGVMVGGPTATDMATAAGNAAATEKLSEATALEAGGVPRNMALTGAGVVRPVDPYTASLLQSHSFQAPATIPQLPETLKGTGSKWSPSRQRWYAPDGKSFNQQGVAVP